MKTKLFTLFFAFLASTGTMFSENGSCGANLTWNLVDGILTISGTGPMSNYSGESAYYSPWYDQRKSITSLIIKNGVTSIGNWAFDGCCGITSVTIPNSVTSIGSFAFSDCTGLTSVEIPNSVTSIRNDAFYGCSSMTTVIIGDGVTSIGGETFRNCTGLTSVTSKAVNPPSLGNGVFENLNCSAIPLYVPEESVEAYKDAAQWKDFFPILPISSQAVEDVFEEYSKKTNKLLRNGQILILRGEKVYTLQEQEVR